MAPPGRLGSLAEGRLFRRLRLSIPQGRGLDEDMWRRRHRVVVWVLASHVVGLAVFAMSRGYDLQHSVLESSALAGFAVIAAQPRGGRRFRASVAATGLMFASALLVHIWDGVTEAHFHFFVMVALLSVYQDWVPFLIALGFVVLHHGAVGVLHPAAVYDHSDAVEHPWRWALIHGAFVLGAAAANTFGWLTSEHDHRRFTDELRRREETSRALFVRNPQPMWVFDAQTLRILAVNQAATRLYGFSEAEFLARSILDMVVPEQVADLRAAIGRGAGRDGNEVWSHQTSCGRVIKVTGHAEQITFAGRDARVAVFFDVTERIALEQELRHRAFHDSLTGLGNRELFLDRLGHALSRRRTELMPITALSIDLDDFKAVNDAHGHVAGDHLLTEIAGRITAVLRPADTAARMGGDEFSVLLEEVGAEEADQVAERILAAVRRPVTIAGTEMFITASIGIAVGHGLGVDAIDLLRSADIAMYEAKARGKGRQERFESGMQSRMLQRAELVNDLRGVTRRGELFLEYQPIVDLSSGRIRSVEALVRWRHPGRGLVGPVDFIPLAEESGSIVEIGAWVLREACAQLSAWLVEADPQTPLSLSVNVSPRQLREPQFVADVAEVLATSGVEPGRLTLEVTEGAVVEDIAQARGCLGRLRGLGVKIAVDDFGTGYSSIGYLSTLPLDEIKIDRLFVRGLTGAGEGRELVLALVRLVDTLDVVTVVEGIETAEELDYVSALGVDSGQGFYFSRPVGPAAIAALLGSLLVAGDPRLAEAVG